MFGIIAGIQSQQFTQHLAGRDPQRFRETIGRWTAFRQSHSFFAAPSWCRRSRLHDAVARARATTARLHRPRSADALGLFGGKAFAVQLPRFAAAQRRTQLSSAATGASLPPRLRPRVSGPSARGVPRAGGGGARRRTTAGRACGPVRRRVVALRSFFTCSDSGLRAGLAGPRPRRPAISSRAFAALVPLASAVRRRVCADDGGNCANRTAGELRVTGRGSSGLLRTSVGLSDFGASITGGLPETTPWEECIDRASVRAYREARPLPPPNRKKPRRWRLDCHGCCARRGIPSAERLRRRPDWPMATFAGDACLGADFYQLFAVDLQFSGQRINTSGQVQPSLTSGRQSRI